jgi:hypothetical protein
VYNKILGPLTVNKNRGIVIIDEELKRTLKVATMKNVLKYVRAEEVRNKIKRRDSDGFRIRERPLKTTFSRTRKTFAVKIKVERVPGKEMRERKVPVQTSSTLDNNTVLITAA